MKCKLCKEYVNYVKKLAMKMHAPAPTKEQLKHWVGNYHSSEHPHHAKKIIG